MKPGEYEFSTGDKEIMEIMDGELDLQVAGEGDWPTVKTGKAFEAPANSKL